MSTKKRSKATPIATSHRPDPRDQMNLIQLATRIPRELHRTLKIHCAETDEPVMDFITRAITNELAKVKK